jgi:hypothetical protein
MTTRLIASSLAEPQKISVNTTFSKPLDSTGPFYVQPGLTSKNVLATVNLKSIGDVAAANTTLMLPKASTDYTFKTASGAVTISTKAVGTTKAVVIASLDLTTVANGYNTPSVQFTDVTAKFHYVTAIKKTAASPAVPAYLELNSLLLSEDKGSSATDGISNSGKISSLSSTTKSTFSYSVDGGKTYTPMTGTSVDLPAKDYAVGSIKIIEISASKIINATTNAKTITVDKTAPAVPVIKLDSDTGISATDGITQNGPVTVSGIEAGAKVSYSLDGITFNPVINGNFIVPKGDYAAGKILVKQTDVAGNDSATAPLGKLSVDTTVAIPSIALAVDTGISATDGITNNKIVNVTGLEVGATWQYSVNGVDFVDGTGTSFDLPKDGEFAAGKVLVKQTDAAGNVSATASLRVATLDTKADDLSIDLAADTGISATDGITNNKIVNVTGLEDGATWQYRIKAGDFVDGTGTSFDLPEDDTYNIGDILVRQTDIAGNVSEVESTNSIDWTLDSTADDLSVALAEDTGISAADGITNIATVNVSGLEDGATWQYSLNGASFVDGTGTSFDLPADLTYGKGDILVRQIDIAGNETEVEAYGTNSVDWTLDSTADDLSIALAEDTGSSATDGVTKVAAVKVGDLEDGATWQYSINDVEFVDGMGTSFNLPEDGEFAAGKVLVKQTDVAGNVSATAYLDVVTLDTVAPAKLIDVDINDTGIDGDYITSLAKVTVNDLEDKATLYYNIDGSDKFTAATDNTFVVPNGTYAAGKIQWKQDDLAGNTGVVTSSSVKIVANDIVNVTAENPSVFDAGNANNNFVVKAGNYTYNIANFGTDDKIDFPTGTPPTVINSNFTDNAVDLQYAANGNVTKLHLTNLTPAQDAAINSVASFNAQFGARSVTSEGNIALFKHTTVSANGSASAAVGDNVFDFVASSYSYSVSDFTTGDALNFPVGTVATLINKDFADNKVVLQWAEGGNLVEVSVTGLTATQDASIAGVNAFKTLFGADSITNNGVPPVIPVNGSTITVSSNGNTSASNGDLTFLFNPGNINYTISGFSAGDVLDFPEGGTATVINKSFTDSAIDVQWAANGNVIVVALTGLSSDSAVGLQSFNNAFGQGSII